MLLMQLIEITAVRNFSQLLRKLNLNFQNTTKRLLQITKKKVKRIWTLKSKRLKLKLRHLINSIQTLLPRQASRHSHHQKHSLKLISRPRKKPKRMNLC